MIFCILLSIRFKFAVGERDWLFDVRVSMHHI